MQEPLLLIPQDSIDSADSIENKVAKILNAEAAKNNLRE